MSNLLSNVHPELLCEWYKRNLPLTPDKITYGSNQIVWWIGTCGHEWQTSVKARSNGEKCPICSGVSVVAGINDLTTFKPELATKQSSKSNTLKPTIVSVEINGKKFHDFTEDVIKTYESYFAPFLKQVLVSDSGARKSIFYRFCVGGRFV